MRPEDRRYVESRSALPYLEYVRRLVEPAGKRLLDIGCGHGWLSAMAAAAGAEYTGVDTDAAILAGARGLYPGARFVEAAAERLPFAEGSFDIILGVDVVEHIPDLARAFAEFHRVLAPGGVVVLFGPNFFWPGNEDACVREKWRCLVRAASGRRTGAYLQRPGVIGFLLARGLRRAGFRAAFSLAPLRQPPFSVRLLPPGALDLVRPTVRIAGVK